MNTLSAKPKNIYFASSLLLSVALASQLPPSSEATNASQKFANDKDEDNFWILPDYQEHEHHLSLALHHQKHPYDPQSAHEELYVVDRAHHLADAEDQAEILGHLLEDEEDLAPF